MQHTNVHAHIDTHTHTKAIHTLTHPKRDNKLYFHLIKKYGYYHNGMVFVKHHFTVRCAVSAVVNGFLCDGTSPWCPFLMTCRALLLALKQVQQQHAEKTTPQKENLNKWSEEREVCRTLTQYIPQVAIKEPSLDQAIFCSC